MVDADITDISRLDVDTTAVADIDVGGDFVRYFGKTYGAYKKALRWRSDMARYRDYYRNTGKHHNTRYYYGFRYWK